MCRVSDDRSDLHLIRTERIAGKQHPRTRLGFRVEELAALNALLATRDLSLDSVFCRIDAAETPWATIQRFRNLPALRCLNTILHMRCTAWTPEEREERGVRVLSLRSEEGRLELLLPEGSVEWAFDAKRLCHLTRATVVANADSALIAGPALVYS